MIGQFSKPASQQILKSFSKRSSKTNILFKVREGSRVLAELCPEGNLQLSETCFKSNPLQHSAQLDKDQLDKEQQDKEQQAVNISDVRLLHTSSFHFQLPTNISCNHCVLRLIVIEAGPGGPGEPGDQEEEEEVQWRICSDVSVLESSQLVDQDEKSQLVGQDEKEEDAMEAILEKGTKTRQNLVQVMLQNIQMQNATTTKSPPPPTATTTTTTQTPTTVATPATKTVAITTTTATTITAPTTTTTTTTAAVTTRASLPPVSEMTSQSSSNPALKLKLRESSMAPPPNLLDSPPAASEIPQVPASTFGQQTTFPPSQSSPLSPDRAGQEDGRSFTLSGSTPTPSSLDKKVAPASESIPGTNLPPQILPNLQQTSNNRPFLDLSRESMRAAQNAKVLEKKDAFRTEEASENIKDKEMSTDDALLEDEMIKELLDKAINATVLIKDPMTGENKTVIIQVFSRASSLQLGLFLSLPATAVVLAGLLVACLWRRTGSSSPSPPGRAHSVVNLHQPHPRSNLLCPPADHKERGRYSMIHIPDLVSSNVLQQLPRINSLPRYTSSPHVGAAAQRAVPPQARLPGLLPSATLAAVSPIPRTVAGLHRQSIHSLPGFNSDSIQFLFKFCFLETSSMVDKS